jgi:glycosyltransferase involved in cell wall biosynthesis
LLLLQPHLPVVDDNREPTEFVALSGLLDTRHARDVQAELRARGRPLVGFTSHKLFPVATAEMAEEYLSQCVGWCHCFRDVAPFEAVPAIDLSHSDLTDVDFVSPSRFATSPPSWDFAYVCLPGREIERAKGWELARECVQELMRAGFTGILIGRFPVNDFEPAQRVTLRPRLRWAEFLRCLAGARCLLVTSVTDASPRVIAEALCLNRPVVVHRDILGGWKYVDDATGAFFTGVVDVVGAVAEVLERPTSPRDWYCESFGLTRSGARLRDFLNALGGNLRAPYVTLGQVPSVQSAMRP